MLHGEISFDTEEQLVICRPIGAFNLEGAIDYEASFTKLISEFNNKPWAILNVYDDFEICGPEVTERLNAQFKWSQANGCLYMGFVTHNSVQNYFVKQVCEGLPTEFKQIFTDIDTASATLQAQLNKP